MELTWPLAFPVYRLRYNRGLVKGKMYFHDGNEFFALAQCGEREKLACLGRINLQGDVIAITNLSIRLRAIEASFKGAALVSICTTILSGLSYLPA